MTSAQSSGVVIPPDLATDVQLRVKRLASVLGGLKGITPNEDTVRQISNMNRAERRALKARLRGK